MSLWWRAICSFINILFPFKNSVVVALTLKQPQLNFASTCWQSAVMTDLLLISVFFVAMKCDSREPCCVCVCVLNSLQYQTAVARTLNTWPSTLLLPLTLQNPVNKPVEPLQCSVIIPLVYDINTAIIVTFMLLFYYYMYYFSCSDSEVHVVFHYNIISTSFQLLWQKNIPIIVNMYHFIYIQLSFCFLPSPG